MGSEDSHRGFGDDVLRQTVPNYTTRMNYPCGAFTTR